MKVRYIIIVFMIIGVGCATKKGITSQMLLNQNYQIFIDDICNIQSETDSTGKILCTGHELRYHTGTGSDTGPFTELEEFRLAFKGNYFAKFFEKIYIDSKLYRMFRDSVEVLHVTSKSDFLKDGLFDCSVCDRVGVLSFRGRLYYYPYYIPKNIDELNSYQILTDTVDVYYRKIYIATFDSLSSGLYIKQIQAADSGFQMSITTNHHGDHAKTLELLKSVRISLVD
ncbi:MAG: hypothetical protein WAU01_05620 [Saprospiraceae bacterium]